MTEIFGITIGGDKKKQVAEPVFIDHRAEARQFRAQVPSLNIISPKVLNAYEVSSIRNKFLVGAGVLLVGIGGLFGYGKYLDGQANSEIEALQAETTSLQNQAAALAPYGQFYTEVGEKRQSLGAVMNGEVDVSALYTEVYNAAEQNGVRLSSIAINIADAENSEGQVTCPTPDPFGAVAGLGCISFEGSAGDRNAIDGLVNSLNSIPGFANAYVPSSSSTETGSTVSGSVLFNEQFRTDRWTDYTLPLDTVLAGDTSASESETGATAGESTTEETVNDDGTVTTVTTTVGEDGSITVETTITDENGTVISTDTTTSTPSEVESDTADSNEDTEN